MDRAVLNLARDALRLEVAPHLEQVPARVSRGELTGRAQPWRVSAAWVWGGAVEGVGRAVVGLRGGRGRALVLVL